MGQQLSMGAFMGVFASWSLTGRARPAAHELGCCSDLVDHDDHPAGEDTRRGPGRARLHGEEDGHGGGIS